jgi:tetratricopeptide (TPR) repeat protein
MSLAVAFKSDRELSAPTEMMPVPPMPFRIVEDTREFQVRESSNPILLQAMHLAERFPDSSAALGRLAGAALNAGELRIAVDSARKGLELAVAEHDQPALFACVEVLMATGMSEEGEPWLSSVDNDNARLLEAELFARRGDHLAALEKLGQVDSSRATALRGWLQVEVGQYALAIHNLRHALRDSPRRADLLTNLGYAYASIGERRKAFQSTTVAMSLDPDNRDVALNLVSYQVAAGNYERAFATLKRLRRRYREDPQLAAASAEVLLRQRRGESALLQLKSVKYWARDLTAVEEAELTANIAFMEWRLDKRSKELTQQILREELVKSDFQSLGIGRMLASLLDGVSTLEALKKLRSALSEFHNSLSLLSIDAQIAFLNGNSEEALAISHLWAKEEPFNSGPATAITHLLCEAREEYSQAAEIGQRALRRIPSAGMLRNNVAFALAMSGRPDEAKRVLRDAIDVDRLEELPYVVATRGVICLAEGDIEGGLQGYRRAASMADSEDLATMILLRRDLAMLELGLTPDFKDMLAVADQLRRTDNGSALVLLGKLDRLMKRRDELRQ